VPICLVCLSNLSTYFKTNNDDWNVEIPSFKWREEKWIVRKLKASQHMTFFIVKDADVAPAWRIPIGIVICKFRQRQTLFSCCILLLNIYMNFQNSISFLFYCTFIFYTLWTVYCVFHIVCFYCILGLLFIFVHVYLSYFTNPASWLWHRSKHLSC